ncbi:MAG: glycoside hydrolase family 127 protein [Bacteroidales bacterium]|nr:glycoside hydrolase family 127 protein [Bacteroidales bacterium]
MVVNPNPPESYPSRMTAGNPADWKPVKLRVDIPAGGVVVSKSGLFSSAMEKNIYYLLNSFSVDHMLYPFRRRTGEQNPPTDDRPQVPFWDTDLRGANAARYLMGAGNTLRWMENGELRRRMDELIDGIDTCRTADDYVLPYPQIVDSLRSEEANWCRVNLQLGLIDAAIAGNPKAYGLLRDIGDTFNHWDALLPRLLYICTNPLQGHLGFTRTYFSPVGKPEDLQTAEKYYVCDWWLDALSNYDEKAIWQYPLNNPHCFLIPGFDAYLDHYIATGDQRYLTAVNAGWDMIRDKWQHVGGSMAICECFWIPQSDGTRVLQRMNSHQPSGYPPYSYFLTPDKHTGETCGNVIWSKLNQRFHCLYPEQEKYVNEIEKSIYNVALANQFDNGSICYHTSMEGTKDRHDYRPEPPLGVNTCCETHEARFLGSLPEYIYSMADDGLYVNLYEPSSIDFQIRGQKINLSLESDFPFKPEVVLNVKSAKPVTMKLRIRVPAWAAKPMPLYINGKLLATGNAGSYVTVSRKWKNGDRITFTLPMELRATKYTGTDTPGAVRYAFEYGPVLLALTGSETVPAAISQKYLTDMNNQLVPTDGLQFQLKGSDMKLIPYWLVDHEKFTVFPIIRDAVN